MAAYYNEINPYSAQWLRNLIAAGHIAPGDVDTRSIEDVKPDDLRPYTQCHFFAGVGVWSYALRLTGWPDDKPVWTGSCPCQPFSTAGKGNGFDDERHLWPSWQWLIQERRPPAVFGEQVASKAVDDWIDLVHADMEAMGYAFGCIPFPSAGVGAPHIRDRTFWVADDAQRGERALYREPSASVRQQKSIGGYGIPSGVADAPNGTGLTGQPRAAIWEFPQELRAVQTEPGPAGPTNGFWRDADWLFCRDGKWRPVEPGTFPLANGAPARVGRLRAYGNAINAEAARIFIECAIGAIDKSASRIGCSIKTSC